MNGVWIAGRMLLLCSQVFGQGPSGSRWNRMRVQFQKQGPLKGCGRIPLCVLGRRCLWSSLYLAFLLPLIAQTKTSGALPSKNVVARIAVMADTIEGAVNQDDALAKTKVWCATIFENTGFSGTDAIVLKDAASAVAMINANELDVLGIPTYQYLEHEKNINADPAMTYLHDGNVTVEYVLIVTKEMKITDIGALKDKRITLLVHGLNVMTRLWGDFLLMKSGIAGGMDSYFKEVKEVQKSSQAILPVFFGQKESAIVTRSSYDAAVALNPQIGNKVTVLASSPPLVPMVTCIRRTLDPALKSRITTKAITLHQTPSGLQSFTMFKIDRFVLWEPSYADTTRTLMRQMKELTAGKVKPELRSLDGRRK
jgi:ABC-type phosphate/phosphonate transport system substrate-binding protein